MPTAQGGPLWLLQFEFTGTKENVKFRSSAALAASHHSSQHWALDLARAGPAASRRHLPWATRVQETLTVGHREHVLTSDAGNNVCTRASTGRIYVNPKLTERQRPPICASRRDIQG